MGGISTCKVRDIPPKWFLFFFFFSQETPRNLSHFSQEICRHGSHFQKKSLKTGQFFWTKISCSLHSKPPKFFEKSVCIFGKILDMGTYFWNIYPWKWVSSRVDTDVLMEVAYSCNFRAVSDSSTCLDIGTSWCHAGITEHFEIRGFKWPHRVIMGSKIKSA